MNKGILLEMITNITVDGKIFELNLEILNQIDQISLQEQEDLKWPKEA